MKLLAAALFFALHALAAGALLVLSVHGPSALATAAPVYLAVAATLMWLVRRRPWWMLAGTGVALLAAAPGLFALLETGELVAYQGRIAATQVGQVADEPLVVDGRPLGVRVSYEVVAPGRGYFSILPVIHGDGPALGFTLQPRRWTFDGRGGVEFGPFEPGRRHTVTVELYPENHFLGPGGQACALTLSRPLPAVASPTLLRIEVYESPYGSAARGGREERTRNAYDLAALYRNVMDALPPCKGAP